MQRLQKVIARRGSIRLRNHHEEKNSPQPSLGKHAFNQPFRELFPRRAQSFRVIRILELVKNSAKNLSAANSQLQLGEIFNHPRLKLFGEGEKEARHPGWGNKFLSHVSRPRTVERARSNTFARLPALIPSRDKKTNNPLFFRAKWRASGKIEF